jgi:hypothetical protein
MQIDEMDTIDDACPSTVVRAGSRKREEVAAYDSNYRKLTVVRCSGSRTRQMSMNPLQSPAQLYEVWLIPAAHISEAILC